jgi:hypothetical protein
MSGGGSAARAEYRHIAADENVIMTAQTASGNRPISGASQRPPARPQMVPYVVAQGSGYERPPGPRAVASNQVAANEEPLYYEQQQQMSPTAQQSPRYMYIMLPRVQQRNNATGGYIQVQNAGIVPQPGVQPGQVLGEYDMPQGYHGYQHDELC